MQGVTLSLCGRGPPLGGDIDSQRNSAAQEEFALAPLAVSADIKLTPAGQDVATFAAPGFCEHAVRIVRETGKPVAPGGA